MPRQYWTAPIIPLGSSDGAAATTIALSDASPIPQKTVPVTAFEVGTCLRMRASGDYTTGAATPTVTFGFYWGTVGSIGTATAIAVSPAITSVTTATAWPWEIDWEGEVRALGSSGQLEGQGTCKFGGSLAGAMTVYPVPATAALRLVTVNTLVAQQLMVGIAWSAITNAPSATCHHVTGEIT